jgi:hypothetical protein
VLATQVPTDRASSVQKIDLDDDGWDET